MIQQASLVDPRLASLARGASQGAALLVAGIAGLGLAGWALGIPGLTSLHPSLVSMKANTALCFLLAGMALFLLREGRPGTAPRLAARLLAGALAVVGALTLSQDLLGIDLGLDQLLFRDLPGSVGTSSPGRMAPIIALDFLLFGLALLLLDVETESGVRPAQWLSILAGAVSLLPTAGYLYGAKPLGGLAMHTQIAVHTGLSFLLLAAGLLLARPASGLVLPFVTDTGAGLLARRLLPAVLCLPLALGWLRLLGQRAGLYGTEFGLALFAVCNVLLLAGLTWWTSLLLLRNEVRRREAQRDREKSERDIATTLQSIGDAVIATDDAGRVVRMNRVAEELTGFTLAEAAQRPLDEVFRIVNEATRAPVESPVPRVLREGIVVGLANHTALIARDGTERPIADSGAPIRVPGGPIEGVVLVFRDVTEEKRWELALRRWALAFEHSGAGMAIASADGATLEVMNPAFGRLLGRSVEELTGRPLEETLAPGARDALPGLLRCATEKGHCSAELRLMRDGGGSFPAIVDLSAARDEHGRLLHLVLNVQDLTAQRLASELSLRGLELEAENRRVQEASRLKSEFLANMSHELRTPLNAIIGFAELLHDRHVTPDMPQYAEFLRDMVASGRHLQQLINDVLDLSKVEAGKLQFHAEPVRLEPLIAEVVGILRADAGAKQLQVQAEVDPALTDLVLDGARLKQVLYNYLSNALKFTPAGGLVSIRATAEEPGKVRVEVEDSGAGIAPEDLGRLFTQFEQLEGGSTKRHGGTGLGLALTRRLVEAQGGTVGVRSTPGKGSVFHAVLPRRAAPRGPGDGARPALPEGSPTVLVVEDDEHDLLLLVRTLSDAGYAVETARTGAEAIARSRERAFEAVTLDLLLPDISGLEVLRELRAAGQNRDVPVIAVTVVNDPGPAAAFSIRETIRKPLDGAALLAALGRAGVSPVPAAGPAGAPGKGRER